jgi:hypothetical protein
MNIVLAIHHFAENVVGWGINIRTGNQETFLVFSEGLIYRQKISIGLLRELELLKKIYQRMLKSDIIR